MAQPLQAAGDVPSDTIVAAEPTIEDRFAAISDEPQDEPQGDIHPEDAAALEAEVAEAELAEVEIDEADLPSITPPVSWTTKEKEEFAELPRALQETLTRREAEREKFVQAKAQEVKTETAKVEQAARERMARARDVHVQSIEAMLPQIPPRPDARLQPRDPEGYANQLAQHEWATAQHQSAQQLVQQIVSQQEADERSAAQQEATENEAILRDKFPEYFGENGAELERSLRSTATFLGYTDDQLAHVNAQDVLAMKAVSELKVKADKFDTLMARQMERVRDGKKLPRISKPGATLGKGVVAGQRYENDRQAMRQGDKDAQTRVFSRFV